MLINSFVDPFKFYDQIRNFLMKHEAENNLIFAILNAIKVGRYKENNLMISVEERNKPLLAAVMTPPHNLLLSYTQIMNSIDQLINFLVENENKIPGILAFKKAAKKATKLWSRKKNISYKLGMNERIYKLEEVDYKYLGPHDFKAVDLTYENLILKWIKLFREEALPNEKFEIDEEYRKITRQRIEENRYFILFDNNQPVSMVHKAGKTPNGNLINQVFTPSNLRRRGYATEAVAKISKLLLDEGNRFCFLFTDLSNPTSNKIYQNVGYRPIIDMDQYEFLVDKEHI